MVAYYNDTLVVTYDELVPRFYKTENALRAVVSRHQTRGYGIKKMQRGGGCEKIALIEFDSLPRHIREELEDPRRGRHILESYFKVDEKAVIIFCYTLPGSVYIPAARHFPTWAAFLTASFAKPARCHRRCPRYLPAPR
jgi:hypothetical protein